MIHIIFVTQWNNIKIVNLHKILTPTSLFKQTEKSKTQFRKEVFV